MYPRLTATAVLAALPAFCLALALAAPAGARAADIAWRQATRPQVINTDQLVREGTATFKDGTTAAVKTEGAYDKSGRATKDIKVATYKAKSVLKFQDGSTITTRYSGTVDPASFATSGKGEFIGGTGRYKGIKGSVTFDGRLSESDWIGTYTLPKK
jgi:hypothetical protein